MKRIFENQSFAWHRVKDISFDDYRRDFLSNGEGKIREAYRQAFELRNFEIKLYWKRAIYFWAFITTIYAAYYKVWTSNACLLGYFPLVVLAGLGFFFSVGWIFALIGSKHWQENWENHIELLEDYVTGPLYKTYQSGSFSVTNVNSAIAWVIAACAGAFFVVNVKEYLVRQKFDVEITFALFTLCIFLCFVGLVVFFFSAKGNLSKDGNVLFDQKRKRK